MANTATQSPKPLNVAIVGAGIVGLTAAAAFRKQGHIVQIFESASFSKEIGAGLQVPPNAARVLLDLGFNPVNARSVEIKSVVVRPSSIVTTPVMRFANNNPNAVSYSVHRVDFHDELRRLATSEELPGVPAKMHLSSAVKSCDTENATLYLANGTTHTADLIVGADGIHSVIRTFVVGRPVHPTRLAIPRAIYRWLAPASLLHEHPDMGWMRSEDSTCGHTIAGSKEDAVIFYTCRDGTTINCVGIHIDKRENADENARNVTASNEELLAEFPGFAHGYKALLREATDVRHWPLLQLEALPTWNKGRTCIIGDAAHAMFPFCGQGGAMGMEDAGALAIMFPLGTTVEQIPAHLAAHQALRKPRAEKVALFSSEQQFLENEEGTDVQHRLCKEDRFFMSSYDPLQAAREHYAATFGAVEAPPSGILVA